MKRTSVILYDSLLAVLAISRRRMDMGVEKVIAAVNSLDLKTLPLESVEILQRMCPTEQEVSKET